MKIFTNGIELKWLAVLFIGIISGISITTAYPIIGDPGVYFGYIHGDCSNCSSIPAAQIKGNFTQNINFSSTITASGLTATSGADVAICRDATTKEITINTGMTDCTASTKSVKENIQTLEQSTISPEKFDVIRPVKFNYIGENKQRFGFIAEEVEKIYPECIGYGDKGEIRGINYGCFVPILAEKIQKQDEIINRQSEVINQLIALQGANVSITLLPTTTIDPAWYEFWK